MQSKKLRAILATDRPDLNWKVNRGKGIISAEAVPICELQVGAMDEPTKITWNPQTIQNFGVDHIKYRAQFVNPFAHTGEADTSSWHL